MNANELLQQFSELLRRPPITWWDVLDILVVSILIYEALKKTGTIGIGQLTAGGREHLIGVAPLEAGS